MQRPLGLESNSNPEPEDELSDQVPERNLSMERKRSLSVNHLTTHTFLGKEYVIPSSSRKFDFVEKYISLTA